MAKYSTVLLKIKGKDLVDFNDKSLNDQRALKNSDVIYIYRETNSKKVYIGQTKHFETRHKQHYNGTEEKFNNAHFDEVLVIMSVYFNGSSLDDVEAQLITYFAEDRENCRNVAVFHDDDVTNRTGGNSINDYRDRENVATDVVLPLWEDYLFPNGWVTIPTLKKLREGALVKYSPIKALTGDQDALIAEIVGNPTKSYVINGDAGTGKTVLLTSLVAKYLTIKKNAEIGVVVQPNWLKIGEKIFKIYGMNTPRLTIDTSTNLISSGKKFDVIIVDESHKLSRRGNKQMDSFNDAYDNPLYANCNSHLEIIQKLAPQVILMYDVLQAIRPANVPREEFARLTNSYEKRFLKTQFRIQAPKGKDYTSEDYINGIKYLLFKDTGLLDSGLTNFDPNFNRAVFNDNNVDAYFGYVDGRPMRQLFDWIEDDRNHNHEHIDRVLSGMFCCETVDKWRQAHGKNPSITHFHEDGFDRRWNWTQENWINSYDDRVDYKRDAEDQIGSVFAVQGIDLNKIGVMIGPDIFVNAEGKLEADPDHHNNDNNKFTVEERIDPHNKYEFTLFILNQYYVLMTRGIDGIRLGFWDNEEFKSYMKETLEIS